MIEELISRVFAARNVAHIAHWKTQSYAQHMALGTFYEALPGAIDTIVEAFQGAFMLVGNIPIGTFPPNLQILPYLEAEARWINENVEALAQGNEGLENEIQGLLGVYLSAIYKLRNLH